MKEIRWHGRGGQGAKTVSELLAMALMDGGYYVQAFPEYGPERSGAPMKAYTRSDERPIRLHSGVTRPDIVVILDESLIGEVAVTEGLHEDGFILINSRRNTKELAGALAFKGRIIPIDAVQLAREAGGKYSNVVMVGALSAAMGQPDLEDVKRATREMFEEKLAEEILNTNLLAVEMGFQQLNMN